MKRLIGTLSLAALLAGCAGGPITAREKGVLGGGALGAGAGALIGSQVDGRDTTAKGALIGGGIGALGGGLLGDQMEGQNQRQNTQAYELERQRYELERQRREMDDLRRRDRYDSYDRGQDPYYDRGGYNRPPQYDPYYDRRGAY
ncbi:MAG: glycine zipper domain-containing protein [Candidatus Binatia bacterium]